MVFFSSTKEEGQLDNNLKAAFVSATVFSIAYDMNEKESSSIDGMAKYLRECHQTS